MPPANSTAHVLPHIPTPDPRPIAVRVTPAAERALREGHPWLFERSIRQQSRAGRPGDLAVVFDRRNRFLAVGLYDPTSAIRIRLLQHHEPATIGQAWFQERIAASVQRREPLRQAEETTGYRLVHGGNDGLPGLVADRYERTLVVKLYTPAWLPHLRDVQTALLESAPAERLILRFGRAAQDQPQHLHGLRDGAILHGPPLDGPVLFQENGLRFEADPIHGQKTGFFLDQRENRARVTPLAAGKAVLDVFAYSGPFSLYAARGAARSVVSLDGSRPALEAARRNFALNRAIPAVAAARHELVAEDAFQALERMGRAGRRFDLVIVDPPAFARNRAQVSGALAAYERLTRLAVGVLRTGGVLVQASCSSRVGADEFFAAVHRAAREAGRPLQEIERTGHPLDHPVGFKEGAYLKCLFARVSTS
ncbi:MAG TPA: class I SAM-dependent rRNA methyltransferase [Chloroflexi bacterium]|nr:class I SAM-dependent rRNA methyltransferase [Chloroflexota bacterium]